MTWLQTASGRAFDLLNPDWRQVDFAVDVPDALARLARFTGHVPGGPYSVAQHCVIGADAVFAATRDKEAAAAFLLHDAHEAYLGDIATPIVAALIARAGATYGPEAGTRIDESIRLMKLKLDEAIYRAAGIERARFAHHAIVKVFDIRMLATERAHLLVRSPQAWAPVVEAAQPLRLPGRISVWPWPKASDEYRERLRRYLPETFAAQPAPRAPTPGFAARRKPAPAKTLTEA
ncbi:hypothetical protein ABIE41_003885 [Bosea sp. OAE506]|uniref:hypothetical protein n=1 Tax=Bosea sp. OAE506 TaxID=2663870 RepID=UPI001789EAB8